MVGIFTPAENDADFDFVAVLQKAARLLDLEVDVVVAGLGTQSNFLELRLVLLRVLRVSLFLFVLELAVIHDSADGRTNIRRDFNEIETGLNGLLQSLAGGNNADDLSVLANDSNRRDADLIVYPMGSLNRCSPLCCDSKKPFRCPARVYRRCVR